jgi:hypothetical protein
MAKIGCKAKVNVYRDAFVPCGNWYGGEQQLCEKCVRRAEREYPQGWRYYPGDVCRHGVYTGGIGVDRMCGRCEIGED